MDKTPRNQSWAWVGLALVLTLFAGCAAETPQSIRYEAERDLWKAGQLARRIGSQPEAAAQIIVEAELSYQGILDRYDLDRVESDSEERKIVGQVLALSALALARLNLLYDEDPKAAAEILYENRNRTPWDLDITLQMYNELLRIQHEYGNPDTLIAILDEMVETLPPARSGRTPIPLVLEAPLRTADVLRENGYEDRVRSQLDLAHVYYEETIEKYRGAPVEVFATMQKANVFLRQGLLSEADETLTRARQGVAAGPFIPAILSMQATLRQKQMNDYVGAIELLEELYTEHPDDARAPGALLQIGINETGASRYAEALAAFEKVEVTYATVPNMASQARFLSGTVLDLQGNWAAAENVFRSVAADFPRTSSGLLAPLQIAAHYERTGNDALYRSTLREAATEYHRIARDLAGHRRSETTVLTALDHLADVYTRLGDWDQAVETLLTRAEDYPSDRRSPFAYVQAAAIQEQQLGNLDGAVAILERMTERYPNLPLSARAKEKIGLMRDPS